MRGDLLILLADGIVILCLARLFLQAAGLSENHALLAFSKRSTDWLVNPLHKILPVKKYDPACLLSGLLLYYIVFTFITLSGATYRIQRKNRHCQFYTGSIEYN